jgi:hypothetical protein
MTPAAPAIPAGLKAWLSTRNVTPRQLEMVAWFYAYQQENGIAPVMQEVADAMGVSKVTVWEHVRELKRKGVFGQPVGKWMARSLRLRWEPSARDLAGECERYRVALGFYAQQAVGGEVARDALEGT